MWSCDTYVAQRDATADGRLLFGKNSDRPPGEPQPLRFEASRDGSGDLQLAYVAIPDAPALAHVGSAPFWCWGYEFGVNAANVVIGNEAQFTRSWAADVAHSRAGDAPPEGIIGMELLRLGLERGHSAVDALNVMTELLERYGQWASGHFGKQPVDGAYDNSYLIADGTDAWVLETSGREWIARNVTSGVYAISNEPSIRTQFDRHSEGLIATAVAKDWHSEAAPFDYAASHADPMTPLQVSHIRQRRAQQLLEDAQGNGGVHLDEAKAVLRDHLEGTFLGGPSINAARPDFLTVCMHEHPSGFTWGNTAGSLIVEVGADADDLTTIWWTPVTPCTGVYIPFFLRAGELPDTLQQPAAPRVARPDAFAQKKFDASAYWWRFQNLLDATKGDADSSAFAERQPRVRERFDRLERQWESDVAELRAAWRAAGDDKRAALHEDMRALTARAVHEADAEVDTLLAQFAPAVVTAPIDTRWS